MFFLQTEEHNGSNSGKEIVSLQSPSPAGYEEASEPRVWRKLDWNLMPLFFVGYMLAFLDRSNVGNAEIAGMAKDLELTGNRYPWLLTIFYITYIVFEFSLLLWKIYPPHIVGAVVVLSYLSRCLELGRYDGCPVPAGCLRNGVRLRDNLSSVLLLTSPSLPFIPSNQHHPPDNQGSDTRRGAGLVLINIRQCGPVLGTQPYPASQAPRYVEGMSVCAAFMFFTALLALVLRVLLVWRNKQLEERC